MSTHTRTPSSSSSSTPVVSLLSLNLHAWKLDGTKWNRILGSLIDRNRSRFTSIAELVVQEKVSIVCLQEACIFQGYSAVVEITEALQKLTGERWSYYWSSAHIAWAGTPDECEEGVGIIAKGSASIIDPEVLEYQTQGPFRRIAVSATVPTPLGHFRVYSVHLEVMSREVRTQQARETALNALVRTDPRFNVVILGDFNDEVHSSTWRSLTSLGFTELANSRGGIDHVFLHRSSGFKIFEDRETFNGTSSSAPVVSDHPGILARMSFSSYLSSSSSASPRSSSSSTPSSLTTTPSITPSPSPSSLSPFITPIGPSPSPNDPSSSSAPHVPITRIIVHCDAGWGRTLTIRGEEAHPHGHDIASHQEQHQSLQPTYPPPRSPPAFRRSTTDRPSSSSPSTSSSSTSSSSSKSNPSSPTSPIVEMNWKKGWPLVNVGPSEWRLVITEAPPTGYVVKVLKDDTVWQSGENCIIGSGLDNHITPSF